MFEIKVKVDDKEKGAKKIDIDITQDGKKFYTVKHRWDGIPDKDQERFATVVGELLGSVGITESGEGVIGPIDEDAMIAFEVGMTSVSKKLNEWAIEDAGNKGRGVDLAKQALSRL